MENEIIENVVETAETAVKENLPVVEEAVKEGLTALQKGLCFAGGVVFGALANFGMRHIPGVKEGINAFSTARKASKEEKKAAKAAKKQQAVEATNVDANPPVEG